jgi:hypothetical protein
MTAQLYPQTDFGNYNNLLNSPADWISPPGTGNWVQEPPEADGSKVIIADVDHIWPSAPQHGWIWKVFVRGSQPILMDFYTHGTPTWISGSEQESMRKNMGYTKAYADKMDLASVKPRGGSDFHRLCSRKPRLRIFGLCSFRRFFLGRSRGR